MRNFKFKPLKKGGGSNAPQKNHIEINLSGKGTKGTVSFSSDTLKRLNISKGDHIDIRYIENDLCIGVSQNINDFRVRPIAKGGKLIIESKALVPIIGNYNLTNYGYNEGINFYKLNRVQTRL